MYKILGLLTTEGLPEASPSFLLPPDPGSPGAL